MVGMAPARYAVHTAKVLETIVWLSNARSMDLYHVVKCAYYADKYHLNQYGRPIAGDDYKADIYGPLGQVIYGLLTGNPLEMIALGGNGDLPFHVRPDQRWLIVPNREANTRILSQSDIEALQHAVLEVADQGFGDLVASTHAEPAYIAANGGRLRYEDMLDAKDPQHAEKAADLAETARYAVF